MSTTETVMNIKGPQIDLNPGTQQTGRVGADADKVAKKSDNAQASAPSDTVTLTETVTEMAKLEDSLSSIPEVDSARVAEFQEQIASGSYQVDPEQIVERLLGVESTDQ